MIPGIQKQLREERLALAGGFSPSCRKGTTGAQTMVAGVRREAVHILVGQEAEREASCWAGLHLRSSPLDAPIRASQPKSHRLLNQCHQVGNISSRHSLDSLWWGWWLYWKNNWAVHPKGEDEGGTVSGWDLEHPKTQHRRYLVILRNRNYPCRQMICPQLPVNRGCDAESKLNLSFLLSGSLVQLSCTRSVNNLQAILDESF